MDNLPYYVLPLKDSTITSASRTEDSGLYNAGYPIMDYTSLLSRPISYFGKEEVWMACGDDVSLFNSNRSNIQNYLKHSGIPESTQSPWIGLYRIGKSQDEARTVLVVSCSDRRIRKLTRDVLRNSPIFQQGGALARFKIISKATPPETASAPELTMQVDFEASAVSLKEESSCEEEISQYVPSHVQSKTVLRLGKSQTGDTYLCRPIQASRWSQDGVLQSRTATAGPLLSLCGFSYQLTVEHLVNFSNRGADTISESTNDDWDSDDENDGDDEEIAPWDIGEAGIRSRTNSSTEGSLSNSASSSPVPELVIASCNNNNLSSSLQTDDFSYSNLTGPLGTCNLIIYDHLAPFYRGTTKSLTRCWASADIDYLLIPVPAGPRGLDLFSDTAEIKDPSDAFSVHGQTEPRPVIITTASLGYVNGVMFPALTLSRKPGSQTFQTLFCVKSHQYMPKGISGSAVFDTHTGLLAGYIVLGCPGKNTWYMTPITDVIDDIQAGYGIVPRCLITLDTSIIAKKNQKTSITPSIIPSKSRFIHAFSQHYSQTLLKRIRPRDGKSKDLGGISQLSHDQWHMTFGSQAKLAGTLRNYQPLLDIFKQQDPEVSYVLAFMSFPSFSSRWDPQLSALKRFCEPAFPPFDDSTMGSRGNCGASHYPQPKLWVSNLRGHSSRSPPRTVQDATKLYETILQQCFSNEGSHTAAHKRRLIYISNPDASCVMALMRTAPRSQINGFQDLFNNYITERPLVNISLRQSLWLGTNNFSMSFNLPFFSIGTLDQNDNSITSSTSRVIRRCYRLSFLNTTSHKSPVLQGKTFLLEAVYSIIVTGESDRCWTAACLSDEYFDDEQPYSNQQSNEDALKDETDPIIAKDVTKATELMLSPRAYYLTALSVALERITSHHSEVQDHLRASLDHYITNTEPNSIDTTTFPAIRQLMEDFWHLLCLAIHSNFNISNKVGEFLCTELMCSPEGLPLDPMWIGTQTDVNVISALRRIRVSSTVLIQLDIKLNELLSTQDKLMRECHILRETQVPDDLPTETMVIIAFVGILLE